MKIEFKFDAPKQEGQYLFRGESGSIHVINVIKVPAGYYHGLYFDEYLANSDNRRNIKVYRGKWTDALEF
jgi:hypothetical protein